MINWLKKAWQPQKPQLQTTVVSAKQYLAEGFQQFQTGALDLAKANFQRVLQEEPGSPDALYMLGLLARQKGLHAEALEWIARAIQSAPSVASFHLSQAQLLSVMRESAAALKSYSRAIELDSNDAESRIGFGVELHATGRSEEALRHLQEAVRIAPQMSAAHYELGIVRQALGQTNEALVCYERVMQLDSGHVNACNNAGVIRHARGEWEQAMTCFQKALRCEPRFARAWWNLGVVQLAMGRIDEAASNLLRSTELDPNNADAFRNLALAQRQQGLLEASRVSSEKALALQDSLAERVRLAVLQPVIAQSDAEVRQWRLHFEQSVEQLRADTGVLVDPLREVGVCNFNLAYQAEANIVLQKLVAQMYLERCPSLQYVAPHCCSKNARGDGRIKVGFISKFMHQHSIGRTTRGLLANMARDRFHITALCIPPLVEDAVSQFIRDSADAYVVLPRALTEARNAIAELELDILFYQDIGMDAQSYYLAFARLAPVQCVSFGHPDTTGIPNMDYWVSSDNFETADAQLHYSEKLVLLRNLGTLAYYYRPTLGTPVKTRGSFGLSDDKHIYVCPQSLFKLHPDFDAILAGILRADSLAEVVFVEDSRTAVWGQLLRQRFQTSMPELARRIRFMPGMSSQDFLALIAASDVMLDPLYFNGMNTSLEGFAVGTPIVTMPTQCQRGRHTYGMYLRMQLQSCVAETPKHYVEIALKLGQDRKYRASVSAEILDRCSVLYEDECVVKEFERFFIEAYQEKVLRRGDPRV